MSEKIRSAQGKTPPEYHASKQKWEKKCKKSPYLKIWEKYKRSGSLKRPRKCDLPPQAMFKRYGVHTPIDPNGKYPSYEEICLGPLDSCLEIGPAVFLVSPDIRPQLFEDGKFYEWLEGFSTVEMKTGKVVDLEPKLVEFKECCANRSPQKLEQELSELMLRVDLTRDKKIVISDLLKLIERYYLLRKYLGFKNKSVRFSKKTNQPLVRISKKDKLIYMVGLMVDTMKCSLRDVASIPKNSRKIDTLLKKFRDWNSGKKKEVSRCFDDAHSNAMLSSHAKAELKQHYRDEIWKKAKKVL